MAPRGEVRLTFVFGPSPTPVLPAALAYAGRHADDLQPDGPGSWRATFRLGNSPGRLGRALQLARMVLGWRATHVEVQGSPEDRQVVLSMLTCSKEWAMAGGACRASFGSRRPPKCRICPLYDPEWALEAPLRATPLMWGEDTDLVPDHVPEEWA
ncbi:MAG TPA: hypothetical protein VF972_10080 [Actinomycetota bacterium]